MKTPLTSIINYVDLLKTEGVDSKNANKYLDILDKKSQRLKKSDRRFGGSFKANIRCNWTPQRKNKHCGIN